MSKQTKTTSQKSPKLNKKILEKIKNASLYKVSSKDVESSHDLPLWTKSVKNYKKFKGLTAEESFTFQIIGMYPYLMGTPLYTAISSYYAQLSTDDAPEFSIDVFNEHLDMLSHYGYVSPFIVETLRTGRYTLH